MAKSLYSLVSVIWIIAAGAVHAADASAIRTIGVHTVGEWRDLWGEAARLAAITPADVRRALEDWLLDKPATIAVALPDPSADTAPSDDGRLLGVGY